MDVSPNTRPLYVDLDDTLVACDTLWESTAALASSRPLSMLSMIGALTRGKAAFKDAMAERIQLDPAALPYRQEVADHVRAHREAGGRAILATGTNARTAQSIADHLGLFDGVLASDTQTNLTGVNKLEAIRADCDNQPFDYAGDSPKDLPVWRAATGAIVVAPSIGLLDRVRDIHASPTVLCPRHSVFPALLKAMRPHQWIKNTLILIPWLLAHTMSWKPALASVLAFVLFSLLASAGYLYNDMLDIQADRKHPRKKSRPLASGALPVKYAIFGIAAFGGGALLIALLTAVLSLTTYKFAGWLVVYGVLTVTYSTLLKRMMLLDVIVLAGLYTLRLLTGGAAIDEPVSEWLLAFSMFLFLSLALMKRFGELFALSLDPHRDADGPARRSYVVEDLDILRAAGPASGYLAILVFALYIYSDKVERMYDNPFALWLVCPVLLYWITRMWILAGRGTLQDDPLSFATRDRTSHICFALIALLFILAGPV